MCVAIDPRKAAGFEIVGTVIAPYADPLNLARALFVDGLKRPPPGLQGFPEGFKGGFAYGVQGFSKGEPGRGGFSLGGSHACGCSWAAVFGGEAASLLDLDAGGSASQVFIAIPG